MKSDNEVIAEWMGFDAYEKLKFTMNWNSIMPVVEKIESFTAEVFILDTSCRITMGEQHGLQVIADVDASSKIEAVYRAVVEFIKWYNTQQK